MSGASENNIDISAFPSGLYFIQIQHEKQVITRKFIKME
ncbi:MAG: T9SS type A sorting domain-containing protein [Saprospiraceae bacterium]|nr:T9SS type A sorting domain-containing protein [Saprospiraceae bacterium]